VEKKKLLPLERYLLRWIIYPIPLPYIITVLLYLSLEFTIIWWILEKENVPFWEYSIPISCGLLAVNSIAIFTINLSNLLKNSTKALQNMLNDEETEKKGIVNDLLERNIYNSVIPIVILIIILTLSALTFLKTGIFFPSSLVTILAYIASFLIMAFLAFSIAMGIGIWKFIYEFRKLPIKIQILHPDNMGGLKKVGEIGLRLSYMTSWLMIIYSIGAIYTPYKNIAVKYYGHLWIIFAIIFVVASFFLPSFSFHKALKQEKEKVLDHLSPIYDLVLKQFLKRSIQQDFNWNIEAETIQKLVNILKFFEDKIENINVWPYSRPFIRLGVIVASQVLVFLLQQYGSHLSQYLFVK